MSKKELAKQESYLPADFDVSSGLDNLLHTIDVNEEEAPSLRNFLKLHQDGEYEGAFTYGAEDTLLPRDNVAILDVETFQHGWQLLDDRGYPEKTYAVQCFQTLPKRPSPEFGAFYEARFYLLNVGREDYENNPTGLDKFRATPIIYGGTSRGRAMFFGKILRYIAKAIASGKETNEYLLYPIVNLLVGDPYKRGRMTIYNPIANILGATNKAVLDAIKRNMNLA